MSPLALAVVCVVAGAGPVDPGPHPFDDAGLAPPDISLYLHVDDGSQLRAACRDRPIGRFFGEALARGVLAEAWETLALRAGVTGSDLFDLWLGEQSTLLVRAGDAGVEWALVATIDPDRIEPVLDRLRLRRGVPRASWEIAKWPEASLMFARDDERIIIGPTAPRRLFFEVLDRMAGEEGPTLEDNPLIAKARRATTGRVAGYMRHDALLGGASAFVADLRGEADVVVRHVAHFDAPPFARPVTNTRWNAAALAAFERHALLATMEPNDIGLGPIGTFAEVALDVPLFTEEIKNCLGDARILTVGEVDGRLEAARHDALLPVGAVAFQLRATDRAPAETMTAIDRHLVELTRSLDGLVEGTCLAELPQPGRLSPREARSIDLAPLAARFGGGFPIMQSASLNWSLATSPTGECYCVVATHPQELAHTVEAISTTTPGSQVGTWTSVGTADGRRLARHLRSHTEALAALGGAPADDARALADTIRLIASLADGLERCRWRLRRPCRNEMDLSITGRLSPPASSE